jgi:hypothetical protein
MTPLIKYRPTWEDNIKMGLKEMRLECVDLFIVLTGQGKAEGCREHRELSRIIP